MASIIANVLRARLFQFGAGLFCAAVLVANVDVKSIIVSNEPLTPTQTSPPPIHITTMKPSSTPLLWSTDPIKIPDYEPTTFALESSAVKSVYVFDYILDKPTVETPRPEASAKHPGLALKTDSTSFTNTYKAPRPSRTEHYTANHQPLPKNYWILKSIQDVLIEVKLRLLSTFPGMAPSFGMVAWYQFRYMQFLRGIPTAEDFKSMALRLASDTTARDREANESRELFQNLEDVATRAVDLLEAIVAAKETSDRNAAYEIERLKSIIVKEEQMSRQNSEKSTRDIARLDSSIKEKEVTIANMGLETQKLTKEVKDLTNEAKKLKEEKDRAIKSGIDAEATDKATIAQLKVQVEAVTKKCEAAEANASRKALDQVEAAEERALQAEKRSAEAAELARISEENALKKQSTIDFLSVTLATNRTAFIEAVDTAKEAKEHAEKTAKILQEQVAELVEEHKEKAARSTARNTKLKDELESERKERLRLTSSNESQRVKDAEEGRIRAEEAARRARGEADHLVRSQTGQLNRAKAMNDTYRARYGKLDEGNTTNASATTNESLSQSSSLIDTALTESVTTWNANSQALNGTLDASSRVDARSDTCPKPGLSFDTSPPSNQSGPSRKKPHRRGTRPRSSKKTSQPGEGLPAGSPTTESTTGGGGGA